MLPTKVAIPYARALLDFAMEKSMMLQIGADLQNLKSFLNKTTEFRDYLNSPTVSRKAKKEILTKTLQSQVLNKTFNFLMVLVNRGRINLLEAVIDLYNELISETCLIRKMDISTAFSFTNLQKDMLIEKLTKISKSNGVSTDITVDSSLIGGFLIKTQSKVIDFTVKNQLQNIAKHFDIVLEI